MAQPVKYDAEAMLDAARELVLSAGPRAANAAAVARVIGAPSGSIYHRFGSRDELVGTSWLRAQQRFLGGFLPLAEGRSLTQLRDAAQYVVRWSVDNPRDAALLVRYSLYDLIPRGQHRKLDDEFDNANGALSAAIKKSADAVAVPLEDVLVAVVDVPYALVRRRLTDGSPLGAADVETVGRAAARLLGLDL